jgi:hypothetical protein
MVARSFQTRMARLILELHRRTQFDQESESVFWTEPMVDTNSVRSMRQDPLFRDRDNIAFATLSLLTLPMLSVTDVARFLLRAFLEQRCPFRRCKHHL